MSANRKPRLVVLLILLVSLPLLAAPGTEWSRTFSGKDFENIRNVIQTTDGGYLLSGTAIGEEGRPQQKLLKLDALGEMEWENVYGGENSETAWSMIETLEGDYLFAGRRHDPGESTVSVAMYLVSAAGEIEIDWHIGSDWNLTAAYPIVLQPRLGIYSVFGTITTPEESWFLHQSYYTLGGIVIHSFPCPAFKDGIITDAVVFGDLSIRFVGNETSQGSQVGFPTLLPSREGVGLLTMLPARGGCDWTQQVTEPGGAAYGIELASDGTLIVVGTTSGTWHTYLAKYDLSGQQLWSAVYGSDVRNFGVDVEATADGGAVVTGNTSDFRGNAGVLVFRVDADGELIWSKVVGDRFDTGVSIHNTSDGGYIIGANCVGEGYGCGGIRVIKLAPDLE